MDEFPHPLFFEARDLSKREKGKIHLYFQKKRDSGGGDCDEIEKVGENTYRICFKVKEDQERVLQKKSHTICLPNGELHLTVSSSSSLDQPSTSHGQTFTKANTKELEKIFQIETFLLFYLRDCPQALKFLQKQLDAIHCSLTLDFDLEEAVVKGHVEKESGGAFGAIAEKWEHQVDKIFIDLIERYTCHHVLEPKLLKKVQQDLSNVDDNIKVYPQTGYVVVVGETAVVKEKVLVLEKCLTSTMELPITEKHLKLIEEEFRREMQADSPEVNITTRTNMVILEGTDEKVKSGAAKLDELVKKIKVKRVQLSPCLSAFMKTSNALSKYEARFQQIFRSPLSLEVDSDLHLSSLSSVSLEEAQAALLRDIVVISVQLQGAATVPPELRAILNKAKVQANSLSLQVEVSFIPGVNETTVQLVGYSPEVTKLKELLHDYQLNQAPTEEMIKLPDPELVECFKEKLNRLGVNITSVTLQTSHVPYPCVILSGPRGQVKDIHKTLQPVLANLTVDSLVLNGPGALRYFQGVGKVSKDLVETSHKVIIREQQGVPNVNAQQQGSSSITYVTSLRPSLNRQSRRSVGSPAVSQINLRIRLCRLEDEQVNILVAPVLKNQLNSNNISKSLLRKGGSILQSQFDATAANRVLHPGEVLQVPGPPSLGCSKIFFIECSPWDGVGGQSAQALKKGLQTCLDLCEQQGFSSVAIPIIGHGVVLKYSLIDAIKVLTEKITEFGSSATSGSLSTINIVIHPDYSDSEKTYHEVNKNLCSSMNHTGQAIFRSLTSDLDEVIMALGGNVQLHLVFGDITNETTDVVVNTTDFTNFHNEGVCKDILTVAGPQVEAELKAAKVNRGDIFVSQSGRFPCKTFFHVCGERDESLVEKLVCNIIYQCEKSGFESVAIPAICAGAGGLDPGVVAGAILRGIKTATSSRNLCKLTRVHIVLIRIKVFLVFKEEATQMFSSVNRKVRAMPQVQQQSPPLITDLKLTNISSGSQQSTFKFIGLGKNTVDDAMKNLKSLYETVCSTQTISKEDMEVFTQKDVKAFKQLVESEGLFIEEDPSGGLTVTGLKDGVTQLMMMIQSCLQGSLRIEMRVREEEDLYNRVMWCILDQRGNWQRLPKISNYNLEKRDIAAGIEDAQGVTWQVNLEEMEATATGQKTKLKRLENLADFSFPLYWDSMTANESMKVVPLRQSSTEYKLVKESFKRTARQTVIKIERLQNIHLRRAYEAQKKHIAFKNTTLGGEREKTLYHGTTHENCNSIMKTGFNRRFAGQNATFYGEGTYFAVNASYSAQSTYSKPGADGSQLMFVVRVLTGVYAQGQSGMKVPPPRNAQQPNERCDSVVDNTSNPSMYVVFHDDQAYPDYLITFK
ncbi:protein mono-ADP-ribosyltransferase PARP14 [Oryzias melastigma]|uniref:protein mono-ADP-ribosyltransferase PARP14 n=1 Tax=Oryzias melastigma TaxID=30732 RepID=UPI00168D1A15|nr:protein mono-ADP-ribosyltransferase PARP14 [Oryzias melastigma]